MRDRSHAALILLFFLVYEIPGSDSSECYLYHHDKTLSKYPKATSLNCISTTKFSEKCEDFRGKYTPFDYDIYEENFEITADPWKLGGRNLGKETVLNVTISNVTFHNLTVLLHDRTYPKKKDPHCQTIKLDKNHLPDQVTLFIPTWFRRRTEIQFVGYGENDTFFREFYFIPPSPNDFDLLDDDKVLPERIFAYIDTTYNEKVRLHVQPLPERYDIRYYKVKFQECTEDDSNRSTLESVNLTEVPLVYSVRKVYKNGAAYDFLLTPVDGNGTEHSSTRTAGFYMWQIPLESYLLIVFALVAPIVVFFVSRQTYIYFRNEAWRNVKVHSLIVYYPTHDLHIDVVEHLALYLKNCNLDVMIDIWDIEKRDDRNPVLWCNEAFAKADIVVVVSSPPKGDYRITRLPYPITYERFESLITENYPRADKYKKYVPVLLPYCGKQDILQIVQNHKTVSLPKKLKQLVDKCHNTNYTDIFDTWKNNKELIQSMNYAKSRIPESKPTSEQKSNGVLKVEFGEPKSNGISKAHTLAKVDSRSDLYDKEGFRIDPVISNKNYQTRIENLALVNPINENESDDNIVTQERKLLRNCDISMA